ncbi:MAG: hypothetical protein AAGL68_05450 [Pseudomonadota bacterium]
MALVQTLDCGLGAAVNMWINGRRYGAWVLELSAEEAQVVLDDDLAIADGALVALLLREFLSFPMRVQGRSGNVLSLAFRNPIHSTVLDLVTKELMEDTISAAMPQVVETKASPFRFGDLEAWVEDAGEPDGLVGEFDEELEPSAAA